MSTVETSVKVIPLGGLEQIGMNMTVFEYGESIIVVDCGMSFPGERFTCIVDQMKAAEGVTEELKRKDAMLWVQRCNNIRNRAEEIVLNEMVYI